MTPDTLALARAIGKLPGAPRRDDLAMISCDTDQNNGYRDSRGFRWVWDPDRSDFCVLDLEDAATGGALLARCLHMEQFVLTDPRGYALRSVGQWYGDWSPTLAIALARLIIARGSWT